VAPTGAGDAVPEVRGDRLGLVIGSSLDHDPVTAALGPRSDLFVLRRHGPGGTVPAHLVDHAANVRALVDAGCDRVLAIGSAGGLHVTTGPGVVVVPDDLFAPAGTPTFHTTTAGYGVRGFDAGWRTRVLAAWTLAAQRPDGPGGPRTVLDGGTYAQTRGPRFETPAEVRWLATCADVVGMTLASECSMAAEAGLAYAAVCQVDNLAAGVGTSRTGDVAMDYVLSTRRYRDALAAELVAAVRLLLDA
jgi:5'-methylthioadenosine phosphorylase